MADDPNAALRAQLTTDRDALAPQIRGLPDIANTTVSPALIVALNAEVSVRVRRRDLLQGALNQLDGVVNALTALEADGWPAEVVKATLSIDLFDELQGEKGDIEAAAAVFMEALPVAITAGDPSFSPNPNPPVVDGP